MKVGARVELKEGHKGTVRYIGPIAIPKAVGTFIGVELDEAKGKNNGSAGGQAYFTCAENHGVFVKEVTLKVLSDPAQEASSSSSAPSPAPQGDGKEAQEPPPPQQQQQQKEEELQAKEEARPPTPPGAEAREEEREEPAAAAPSLHFSASPSEALQTVPLKTFEDLKKKLAILESKRATDREQLRDLERVREELKKQTEANAKLQASVQELTQQLREARKDFTDYKTEQEEAGGQAQELMESIELLTLDKEMAEERCEALQQEVDMLKEKVEELTLDLEIIRGEKEESGESPLVTTSVEYVQLEKQNERLKEALVKLRDVTTEEKNEMTKKLKDLEKLATDHPALQAKYDKAKAELKELKEEVQMLREALEDAQSAQQLAEDLTEKNMALEDKIQDLRGQIEDLEALRQLNEELEEGHLDTERQLQDEIEHKDSLLRNQVRTLESAQESLADSENVIIQYRELVARLRDQIRQNTKEERGTSEQEGEEHSQQESQEVKELRMQLQTTSMRAQSKAVDLELRRLEAEQAAAHLNFVIINLPDVFFKDDHPAIKAILACKRIFFKSDLILKNLEQTYMIMEGKRGANEMTPEHLNFICQLKRHLSMVSGASKRIILFSEICSVEEYLRLGEHLNEALVVEKKVDVFVELLRKEALQESLSLKELDTCTKQLIKIGQKAASGPLLQSLSLPVIQALSSTVQFEAEEIYVLLKQVHTLIVGQAQELDELGASAGSEEPALLSQIGPFLSHLREIQKHNKTIQVLGKKLERRCEELEKSSKQLSPEFIELLASFKERFGAAKEALFSVTSSLTQRLQGIEAPSFLDTISEVIQETERQHLQAQEGEEPLAALLALLEQHKRALEKTLDDSYNEESIAPLGQLAKGERGWERRSEIVKGEYLLNREHEGRIRALSEEISARTKDLKEREEQLEACEVKVALLEERRSDAEAKLKDEAAKVQAEEDKLRKEIRSYKEAFEKLQRRLDDASSHPARGDRELAQPDLEMVDSGKVVVLRNALQALEIENARLRAAKMLQEFAENDPFREAHPRPEVKQSLASLKQIASEIRESTAGARVVDLKAQKPRTAFGMVEKHKASLLSLGHKLDELQVRLTLDRISPAEPQGAGEQGGIQIATLRLPQNHPSAPPAPSSSPIKLHVDHQSFARVHSLLVA